MSSVIGLIAYVIFNSAQTERNYNAPFAAPAFDFHSIWHQPGDQAAAMATKRIAILSHRLRRFLFALP